MIDNKENTDLYQEIYVEKEDEGSSSELMREPFNPCLIKSGNQMTTSQTA